LVGASVTRHAYTDKRIFFIHREIDGEQLYIGNSSILKLPGNKRVIPKLIYEKFLTLNNVLYIYNMEKKVFGLLLSKHGFKMIFDEL